MGSDGWASFRCSKLPQAALAISLQTISSLAVVSEPRLRPPSSAQTTKCVDLVHRDQCLLFETLRCCQPNHALACKRDIHFACRDS
jgi:hypothetical protein